MKNNTIAFFAYGSETPACGEAIEQAIKKINESGHPVLIKSWKSMSVSGHFLITTILHEIAACDFFCCDITNLNENVLFELGYAIARNKPVWIIQDVSITASYQRYKEFILLNNIGYTNYSNTKNIVDGFLNDKVYNFKKPLIDTLPVDDSASDGKNLLFYLKSQIDNNYNQYIIGAIESDKISVLIDDSSENKVSPISWYLKALSETPAVLVEFSAIDRSNYQIHNAKCALIAGLALGFDKTVKLIAAHPYPMTIDYQEHLSRFNNLEVCQRIVDPFLATLKSNAIQLLSKKTDLSKFKRKEGVLQKIQFGEMLAEHESQDIYRYYVNTANDDNLLKSEYNIVVGRKGSGKTASVYYLSSKYSRDIRNQIVLMKPVNFEIDGLIELIQGTNIEFGKSYIVESVWKFLIYTEVIKSIYLRVCEKAEYSRQHSENSIIEFVEINKEIILPDLSSRLDGLINELSKVEGISDQSEFRSRFSQVLHHDLFKQMVSLIINFMITKGQLIVLIDNLDKNWRKGSNIEITSKFILGLLGVIGRINKELKGGNKHKVNIRTNLVVFLRSDIFKQVLIHAREPDKIEYTRLIWNDPEILFRLIDSRIDELSTDKYVDSKKFWKNYIVDNVDGKPIQEYISDSIIPRPRDLIFLLGAAKSSAVAKGQSIIRDNDLKSAYEEYSNWVFQSLLVENGVTISQIKDFFYHLIGEKSILSLDVILDAMKLAGIESDSDEKVKYFIDHLFSLSFIGKEIRRNEFYFDYGYEIDDKRDFQAAKFNSRRFKIHNAFIPYMECSDFVR